MLQQQNDQTQLLNTDAPLLGNKAIASMSQSSQDQNVSGLIPHQFIIKLKPNSESATAIQQLKSAFGLTVSQTTKGLGFELWEMEPSNVTTADVNTMLTVLSQHPLVDIAELNSYVSVQGSPDDPGFNQLWGLNNTGQTGGVVDADIDAPEAWSLAAEIPTDANVVVGVIDTGVDYSHPDLANNMWTNPGEIPGDGIDNDGNGYIDDYYGYDFVNEDGDPFDDHGHGTHVAGTIAASTNNGLGVAGVAPNAKIMALKFLSQYGSGTLFDAIQAIDYAVLMGADLTNNSWGGGGFSQALEDAIATAGAADQLFVAAAGNNYGNDNDTFPLYPASYELDNIISVAATDNTDNLSFFSNHGATSVDLGAPGSAIYSTYTGGGYATLSGTSMAAPHVAGAAALLLSKYPSLTSEQVKALLLDTADPLDALEGITVSGGRLNLANAIGATLNPGSITGSTWHDLNQDGEWDPSEPALENWVIFLDDNQNGILDDTEQSTLTDANGQYTFTNLAPGSYTIAEEVQSGWQQVYPVDGSISLFKADFSTDEDGGGPSLDGFTIDNTGSTVEGLWHLSTGRGAQVGHSPGDSLYFGQGETSEGGGNYDVGSTAGRVTSPVIDLNGVDMAELSFNYILDTEGGAPLWDNALVQVSANGGAFEPIASNEIELVDPTTEWTNLTVDLSDYAGSDIQIQFDFRTGDGLYNTYEGWYIDDVEVHSVGTGSHSAIVGSDDAVTDLNFGNILLNQPPVAEDDSFSTNANSGVSGNLLLNDSDINDDPLTISHINGNAITPGTAIALNSGAWLDVNSDGHFSYDPDGTFDDLSDGDTAIDSFSYTVMDDEGESTIATVSITINGIAEPTLIIGTPNDDELTGNSGDDQIFGLDGNDVLHAKAGNDLVYGGLGSDSLLGGSQHDFLSGGGDDDLVDGGGGDDQLLGNSGQDTLLGHFGADSLVGGQGNDMLLGGFGRDHLKGGIGDDVLDGEGGQDTIFSGPGADTIVLRVGQGLDMVFDFEDGADLFGLDDLTFDQLQLTASDVGVMIQDAITETPIAQVIGASVDDLTEADFIIA